MFKTFVLPLVFASLTAAALALVSDRRGFEELAVRAAIAEEARISNSKCPLSPEYTDTADIGPLSICLILILKLGDRPLPTRVGRWT